MLIHISIFFLIFYLTVRVFTSIQEKAPTSGILSPHLSYPYCSISVSTIFACQTSTCLVKEIDINFFCSFTCICPTCFQIPGLFYSCHGFCARYTDEWNHLEPNYLVSEANTEEGEENRLGLCCWDRRCSTLQQSVVTKRPNNS